MVPPLDGLWTGNPAVGGNSSNLVESRDAVSRDADAFVAGRQGASQRSSGPWRRTPPPLCGSISVTPPRHATQRDKMNFRQLPDCQSRPRRVEEPRNILLV